MDPLKAKFAEKALAVFTEFRAFMKAHGDTVVGEITLAQIQKGARGVKYMITETSELSAEEGIRFRGYSIPELKKLLPKVEGDTEPLPEGIFYLMLTGDIPTREDVDWLTAEWRKRSTVPQHVFDVLEAFPKETHPMTQFSTAILSMQPDSHFAKAYAEGVNKKDYWSYMYEDVMDLAARLPRIAAYIYRKTFHNGDHIDPDPSLDWAANLAHMLGVSDSPDFKSLMRLYLTIHADHEGGNASAHATHLCGSTLSDAYYSLSSGINALAGPLHGLANQEVIKWVLAMRAHCGTDRPSKEQLADYARKTIAEGRVIPGYGHAVLRIPDPRFTAQMEFAKKYFPDDELVNVIWDLFDVIPKVLQEKPRIKSPWPNVDAHSGATLMHYGLKEFNFYTVLFGVSRALGVMASLCWSRALGFPIVRPKSISLQWMKNFVASQEEVAG